MAALILAAACALAAALCGCATYTAVVEAPEGFWLHVEAILAAVWQDVVSIVDLLL